MFSNVFTDAFWAIASILTTIVTGLINQGLKIENGKLKRVISWVIGAGSAVAAWACGFITFEEPQWIGVVSLALVVSLSANGIYEFDVIKKWIKTWFKTLSNPAEAEKKE